MKLLERNSKTDERTMVWSDYVREAVKAELEVRRLGNRKVYKLSAAAFQREALRFARSTPERIATLRKMIDEDAGRTLPATAGALRRMRKMLAEESVTATPKTVSRLAVVVDPLGDATAELGGIAYSLPELFAAAVSIAAERHPEVFGENTRSIAEWQHDFDEAQQRRDMLLRELVTRWVPGTDVRFVGKPGHMTGVFTITEGAVELLENPQDCGRAVVEWIVGHADTMRALGVG